MKSILKFTRKSWL